VVTDRVVRWAHSDIEPLLAGAGVVGLLGGCEWYTVYDIAEALYADLNELSPSFRGESCWRAFRRLHREVL
jgi:hypothetical protein